MATPLYRIIPLITVISLSASGAGCRSSEPESELGVDLLPPVEGIPESVLARLPEGASMETLRTGRDQYGPCLVCHGPEAEGTQLGPEFRTSGWVHSDGTIEGIETVIRSGVARPQHFPVPMPAMGGGAFDEEHLRALATYVYALSIARESPESSPGR
ncbi:MAG: cytochrome c [Gemmatimonadota bacterium]|jgi:mono/diheme cytochrome c family protein|nr:cytochrome c [Gemmatimonadota bacterium]